MNHQRNSDMGNSINSNGNNSKKTECVNIPHDNLIDPNNNAIAVFALG